MRVQWCREHIDETAEKCGLGTDIVSEVKQVTKFCASNPAFADCSTRSIIALIRIKDKRLTEQDIKKITDSAYKEVRTNLTTEFVEQQGKKKPSYNGTPQQVASDVVIETDNNKKPIHKQSTPAVVGRPKGIELPKSAEMYAPALSSNAKYFDKPILSPAEKESFTNIWVHKCLTKDQKEILGGFVLGTGAEFKSNLDAIGTLISRYGCQGRPRHDR